MDNPILIEISREIFNAITGMLAAYGAINALVRAVKTKSKDEVVTIPQLFGYLVNRVFAHSREE